MFAKSKEGSIAAGAMGSAAALFITNTTPPDYTRTKWVKYYSSYYGEYVYRYITNTYQDKYKNADELLHVSLSSIFVKRSNGYIDPKWVS